MSCLQHQNPAGVLPPRPLQSFCHSRARGIWDMGRRPGWTVPGGLPGGRVASLGGAAGHVTPTARVGGGGDGGGEALQGVGSMAQRGQASQLPEGSRLDPDRRCSPCQGHRQGCRRGGWLGSPPPSLRGEEGGPQPAREAQPQTLPAAVCRLGPDEFAPKTPG